jgi:hypothetical protein
VAFTDDIVKGGILMLTILAIALIGVMTIISFFEESNKRK